MARHRSAGVVPAVSTRGREANHGFRFIPFHRAIPRAGEGTAGLAGSCGSDGAQRAKTRLGAVRFAESEKGVKP